MRAERDTQWVVRNERMVAHVRAPRPVYSALGRMLFLPPAVVLVLVREARIAELESVSTCSFPRSIILLWQRLSSF
jgi:hypothetical protein